MAGPVRTPGCHTGSGQTDPVPEILDSQLIHADTRDGHEAVKECEPPVLVPQGKNMSGLGEVS